MKNFNLLRRINIIISSFVLGIFVQSSAYADNVINITNGEVSAIGIAVNDFTVNGYDSLTPSEVTTEKNFQTAKEIVSIIKNDLQNSGVFRPISNAAFIENKIGVAHTPLFAAWQQINASLLLNGDIRRDLSGKLSIKFILWDSYLEKQITSGSIEINEKEPRRAAHKIADQVYSHLTGFEGYFDSKIVYVAEKGPYLKREKRIAIMDQDGANHEYLTDGKDLVLTPRFSPDGKKILYLSYRDKLPKVYEMDIASKKSRLIGNFPGMSFAPHFSPDGKFAIMSVAKNGTTHIYEINLLAKTISKLTFGDSINTSPTYSPDGRYIVFNSDRNGARQLFIMNRDGSDIRRISSGSGVMAEPTWSPNNNYVAFTKISRDHGFTIGVMKANVDSSDPSAENDERLITKGYLVESPSWAPNSRQIIFTRGSRPPKYNPSKSNKKGKGKEDFGPSIKGLNKIYAIDFTGYNERIIPTPHDASDPNWSPLRKD